MIALDDDYVAYHNGNVEVARMKAEKQVDDAINALNNPARPFATTFRLTFSKIFFTTFVGGPNRDPGESHLEYSSRLKAFYQSKYSCVPFDCIIYFTPDTGTDLSTGAIGVVITPGEDVPSMAHEIGHTLGLTHLGANNNCCETTNTMMCAPVESFAAITPLNAACDFNVDHVNGLVFTPSRCDIMDDVVPPFPDDQTCPPVEQTGIFVHVENPNPVLGCKEGADIFTVYVTFKSGFDPLNIELRLVVSEQTSSFVELVNDPEMDFNCTKIFTGAGDRTEFWITDPVTPGCENEKSFSIGPLETITVKGKLRYKEGLPISDNSFWVKAFEGAGNVAGIPNVEFWITPFKNIAGGDFTEINWDYNNPLLINGSVVMNNSTPYDFSINKKLYFAPGAELVIETGSTVKMPHVQVEGCSTMWKGITVQQGANLEMSMMTSVEDAQYAVNVQKGATVNIQSCKFTDNNYGIHTAPEGAGNYNITALGNEFINSGAGLKPAYSGQLPAPGTKSFAGIYLKDKTDGLLLDEDPVFKMANKFSGLHYGIYAENSNITLRTSEFTDLIKETAPAGYPGPLNTGIGVYLSGGQADMKGSFAGIAPKPLTLYNCHYGILAQNANIEVSGCEMGNMTNGISTLGGINKAYKISWNSIGASERGIHVYYTSGMPGASMVNDNTVLMNGNSSGRGIDIGGTEMFPQMEGTVLNNNVTINEGATGISVGVAQRLKVTQNTVSLAGSSARFGIRMEGGDRNTINCNTILNPGGGDNDGIYAVHAGRAGLLCNTTDGSPRGIHFEGMLTGKNKAEVAGNTMKNNSAAGLLLGNNAVVGPQTHRGNKWQGTSAVAGLDAPQTSKFTVDAAENADFLPLLIFPQPWFVNLADPAQSYQCTPGISCPLPNEASDYNLDIKIVRGELETPAANWLGQRRFYELVMENGNPYPGNNDVNSFLSQAVSTGLANYANIQVGIRQLGALSESARTSAAAGLLSQNGTLTGSAPYQANEIAVNSIFLQTAAVGNLTLSGAQTAILEPIAAQCPITGGEAVLRARALLELNGGTPVIYNDGALCNAQRPSAGRSASTGGGDGFVSVYPNPVSNVLTIEYAQKSSIDAVHFLLFDATGRLIRSCELKGMEGKQMLDVQALTDGIYLYSVPGITTGKIQVQH